MSFKNDYKFIIKDIQLYLRNDMPGSARFKLKVFKHFEYYIHTDKDDLDYFYHIILFARLHGYAKITFLKNGDSNLLFMMNEN